MKIILTVLLTTCFCLSALGRDWQRVEIPGAQCANGSVYSVFIDNKGSDKLYVEFMGGGACWSTWSCYGPSPKTWSYPVPMLPYLSVMSSDDPERSPVHDHTAIYFPYCTGDVYAGDHTAKYQLGATVHHRGKANVQKALAHLEQGGLIDFKNKSELALYGASAGAIGSFIHAHRIAKLMPSAQKKRLIADAPGLHFGKDFWNKFSEKFKDDVGESLQEINLNYDRDDGLLAPGVVQLCRFYDDFDIGILQGSQDLIMAYRFGEIDRREHEKLVYSELGVYEQTKKAKNCAAWVPASMMHTFLVFPLSAKIKTSQGEVEALDFARRIFEGETQQNYR